jgi:hypothetical protein
MASAQLADMAEIYLNHTPTPLDPLPQTWGDLLDILDDQATRAGMLLTGARIDGVDVPAFRDPSMTVRRLAAVGRVDVEAATPAVLIRQCLLDSMSSLEELAGLVASLGPLYRTARVPESHHALSALACELNELTSLVDTLEGPLKIDIKSLTVNGATAHQHVDALVGALEALLTAREAQNWTAVADVLQNDLGPRIRALIAVLSTISSR